MKANTYRELVTSLGIGDFNATMVIPTLPWMPMTTDPKSPATILLVRGLQKKLVAMGANVNGSGYLDTRTAAALDELMGPSWSNQTWATVIQSVLAAGKSGYRFGIAKRGAISEPISVGPQGPMGMFDFLPDVPGGKWTYAVAGLLLWATYSKKLRRASRFI